MGLKEFLFKQRGDRTPETIDNKDIAAILFLGICAIFIAGLNIFIISALLLSLLVKILRIEYERRYGYSVGMRILSIFVIVIGAIVILHFISESQFWLDY